MKSEERKEQLGEALGPGGEDLVRYYGFIDRRKTKADGYDLGIAQSRSGRHIEKRPRATTSVKVMDMPEKMVDLPGRFCRPRIVCGYHCGRSGTDDYLEKEGWFIIGRAESDF